MEMTNLLVNPMFLSCEAVVVLLIVIAVALSSGPLFAWNLEREMRNCELRGKGKAAISFIAYLKIDHNVRLFLNRFNFSDGLRFVSYNDAYGESWSVIKICGTPQHIIEIHSEYDCTGKTFCKYVDNYFCGLITVGHYGIDV